MEKNSRKDSQITFNTQVRRCQKQSIPRAQCRANQIGSRDRLLLNDFLETNKLWNSLVVKKIFSLKNLKNKIPKMKQNTRVLIFQAANFEASAFGNSSSTSSKYILKSASHIPHPPHIRNSSDWACLYRQQASNFKKGSSIYILSDCNEIYMTKFYASQNSMTNPASP